MPYIAQKRRESLSQPRRGTARVQSAGELAFVLAAEIDGYLTDIGERGGPRFDDLAGIVGALESVRHEFDSRVLAPYEELKRAYNGKVGNWL